MEVEGGVELVLSRSRRRSRSRSRSSRSSRSSSSSSSSTSTSTSTSTSSSSSSSSSSRGSSSSSSTRRRRRSSSSSSKEWSGFNSTVAVVLVVVVTGMHVVAVQVVAMVVAGHGVRDVENRKGHKTGVCNGRAFPKPFGERRSQPGPPRHRGLLLGRKTKLPEDTAENRDHAAIDMMSGLGQGHVVSLPSIYFGQELSSAQSCAGLHTGIWTSAQKAPLRCRTGREHSPSLLQSI